MQYCRNGFCGRPAIPALLQAPACACAALSAVTWQAPRWHHPQEPHAPHSGPLLPWPFQLLPPAKKAGQATGHFLCVAAFDALFNSGRKKTGCFTGTQIISRVSASPMQGMQRSLDGHALLTCQHAASQGALLPSSCAHHCIKRIQVALIGMPCHSMTS